MQEERITKRFQQALDWRAELYSMCQYLSFKVLSFDLHESQQRSLKELLDRWVTLIETPYDERASYDQLQDALSNNSVDTSELEEEIDAWADAIWQAKCKMTEITYSLQHASNVEPHPERRTAEKRGSAFDARVRKLKNLHSSMGEILMGRKQLTSFPLRVIVDATSRCNFKCRTCYQSAKMNIPETDINRESLRFLEKVLPHTIVVYVGGTGEPLLSAMTSVTLSMSYEARCRVVLMTNGSYMSRLAEILPSVDTVNLSFDGARKRTFELLRHGANFTRIVKDIEALPKKQRKKLFLTVTVNRVNLKELEEIGQLAIKMGVRGVILQPMISFLPWHEYMRLRKSDRATFEKQMSKIRKFTKGTRIKILSSVSFETTPDGAECFELSTLMSSLNTLLPAVDDATSMISKRRKALLDDLLESALEMNLPKKPASFCTRSNKLKASEQPSGDVHPISELMLPYCLAPWTLFYLKSNGNAQLCCVMDKALGNVYGTSFEDVWNGPGYREARRRLSGQGKPYSDCRTCNDFLRYHYLDWLLMSALCRGIMPWKIKKPARYHPHRTDLRKRILYRIFGL